jgi:hypothetical protein
MYKVTKLKYVGETSTNKHKAFTYGKEYYLRRSQDGNSLILTTDTFDKVLIDNKLTVQRHKNILSKFVLVENMFFKNYKEFRIWLTKSK